MSICRVEEKSRMVELNRLMVLGEIKDHLKKEYLFLGFDPCPPPNMQEIECHGQYHARITNGAKD
jgi:hypothetical protein